MPIRTQTRIPTPTSPTPRWPNRTGWSACSARRAVTWSSTPIATPLNFGSVAVDPATGTFVAENGGWQQWYDSQVFYRSTDGLTWTALDPTAFTGSHDIRDIQHGWVDASTECP